MRTTYQTVAAGEVSSTTTTSSTTTSAQVQKILQDRWQKNIGPLNGMIIDIIEAATNENDPPVVEYAILETACAPRPSVKYFMAIIKRCHAEGWTRDEATRACVWPLKTKQAEEDSRVRYLMEQRRAEIRRLHEEAQRSSG